MSNIVQVTEKELKDLLKKTNYDTSSTEKPKANEVLDARNVKTLANAILEDRENIAATDTKINIINSGVVGDYNIGTIVADVNSVQQAITGLNSSLNTVNTNISTINTKIGTETVTTPILTQLSTLNSNINTIKGLTDKSKIEAAKTTYPVFKFLNDKADLSQNYIAKLGTSYSGSGEEEQAYDYTDINACLQEAEIVPEGQDVFGINCPFNGTATIFLGCASNNTDWDSITAITKLNLRNVEGSSTQTSALTNVTNSAAEVNLIFKTGATAPTILFPAGYKYIGNISIGPNSCYIMSIKNGIIICSVINTSVANEVSE